MAPVAFPASVASALVCESLQPDHMITSAGEVFVCLVFSAASELLPMRDLPMLKSVSRIEASHGHSPHDSLEHTTGITTDVSVYPLLTSVCDSPEVAQSSSHESLSSFRQEIRLLDLSLGGVYIRQIQSGSRVTPRTSIQYTKRYSRVKDSGETASRR